MPSALRSIFVAGAAVIGIAMVRASGRALLGPPPDRLLDPVPWADLRRALLGTVPDLRSHLAGDERNVILTFARIRATLETGRFLAKDAAAAWAIERTDDPADRAVLARARSLYLDGIAAQDWGELRPAIGPCAERLIAAIERAAAGPPPRDADGWATMRP